VANGFARSTFLALAVVRLLTSLVERLSPLMDVDQSWLSIISGASSDVVQAPPQPRRHRNIPWPWILIANQRVSSVLGSARRMGQHEEPRVLACTKNRERLHWPRAWHSYLIYNFRIWTSDQGRGLMIGFENRERRCTGRRLEERRSRSAVEKKGCWGVGLRSAASALVSPCDLWVA